MDGFAASGRVVGELASRAPEWAVAAALLLATGAIVVAIVPAMVLAGRKLLGIGATPEQVAGLLDKKINGGLVRIEAKLDELSKVVAANRGVADDRHADNREMLAALRERLAALEATTGRRRP